MSDNFGGFHLDDNFMLREAISSRNDINLQQLSPLKNYSETPCVSTSFDHPLSSWKMNHIQCQTVKVVTDMDVLEKFSIASLVDTLRSELNTPPIKREQGNPLQAPYFDHKFGGLDPNVENSVDLKDLIGILDQEDYDALLRLSGSPADRTNFDIKALSDQDLKLYGQEVEEVPEDQSLVKGEIFITLPAFKEEYILPLTVAEEEVESFEQPSVEEDYLVTSSAEENTRSFETVDIAAIPENLIQQQDAVISRVPVASAKQVLKVQEKSTLKAGPASRGRPVTSRQRKEVAYDKNSSDYRDRRDRNNASVRKSRDKARQRQEETEGRLETLNEENRALQEKVDSLQRELDILRGLFTNIGAAVPNEIKILLAAGRH